MAITPQQVADAKSKQDTAAHDPSRQVRLIAGPGTGKSFAICERVRWLLEKAVPPGRIYVVSFTRAASLDLRRRVQKYCQDRGFPSVDRVNVSTLHSLALRALSAAGLLAYPARPLVMDDWELERIFDAEFSKASGCTGSSGTGYTPARCQDIRRDYEAYCGTGIWGPPNYIPPEPPISQAERDAYQGFHNSRTQVYSCVLPGEIVRQCVERMTGGTLDPTTLLGIEHLVVDEYQDLNPIDLDFVDRLISGGAAAFVAGDDDQSIYSFRFASPQGIQTFVARHPGSGDHALEDCFRCTSGVVDTARALLHASPQRNRIPKRLVSLYDMANPPEAGVVHRWRFSSGAAEARAISESCHSLTASGLPARRIMILLGNTRVQLPPLTRALAASGVKFESPRADSFIDTRPGRFVLALLRVVCEPDDYVAHRLLLGLRPGVGAGICNSIADAVAANNLNYRDTFHHPLPQGVLSGRQLTALRHAQALCARISNWAATETLAQRSNDILDIVQSIFGPTEAQEWHSQTSHLPPDITLDELRDYLWADTDEQQESLLNGVYQRLNIPVPSRGFLPEKVRIMTMHGAKGLEADVVFLPGLEEGILPGTRSIPYPGLVEEAARMLYVSVTRARAACVLSYAQTRIVYGKFSIRAPSRFAHHLAGAFDQRQDALTSAEVMEILRSCSNL